MRSERALWRKVAVWLGSVETFVGVSAVAGGVALIADPSGSRLGLATSLLRGTPFHTFLVPGIILLVAVGLLQVVAAGWTLVRGVGAVQLSAIAGVVITGWIVVEVVAIGFAWQQLLFLCLGPAEIILAGQLRGPLFNNLRAL